MMYDPAKSVIIDFDEGDVNKRVDDIQIDLTPPEPVKDQDDLYTPYDLG